MRNESGSGILLLALLTAACGRDVADGPAPGESAPEVRDSAGIRIVEYEAAAADRWHVGAEPLFTVGWNPDDPEFTWPQSGRILPDGGALVGEYAEGVIYRFGPDGSVVDTLGRKGEGPGEYQSLDAIVSRADTILVSDGRLGRVTILSADGEVRAVRRLLGAPFHQVSAIFSDGRLLLVPGDQRDDDVAETRPEWVFETRPILALDPEGSMVDTLTELPHLRRWYGTSFGSPGPIRVKGRAEGFEGGFAWARSDRREIRWYDESGRLLQIARWVEEPVPLGPEFRSREARVLEEAYRSRGVGESSLEARLAELEEELDRHEGPLPYWESFHVDRLGNAWLSEYPLPGEDPGRWRVFTRGGTFIGWIELPEVVAILDITDDRILAVRHDELDVPAVAMLELIKR